MLYGMSGDGQPVLYNETLRSNPPMKAAALFSIAAAVVAINLALGIYLVLLGAWPVTPFMGLDAILLAGAFQASRNAASRHERIRLTPATLRVDRYPARGIPICFEFNPYWVRVRYEESLGRGSRLALASHGRSVQIGAFLSPAEKLSVAQRLRTALAESRRAHFG